MVKKWDLGLGPRTFGTPETLGTSGTPGTLGQSKFIATVISLIFIFILYCMKEVSLEYFNHMKLILLAGRTHVLGKAIL